MQGDLFARVGTARLPIAYEITAETYEAAVHKLNTVPRDQWPSPEICDRVYIGVRLYQMELAEREADRSPTEGDGNG